MNVMLTPSEVAARVWDDYLHRFGAEAYVMARYIAARPTIPMNEDAPDLFLRTLPDCPPNYTFIGGGRVRL
jgi:hypothetical protein